MTESDENADTQEATHIADRGEQIREQLQQIPDNPSLGNVTVAADVLAGARELTEEEPAVAGDFIHEICQVLGQVSSASLGKGATVLPGEFTGRVYREGMAALAALDSYQLSPSEAPESRVESVLGAIQAVLSTDNNHRATVHTISVSGDLSTVAPKQVGDALDTETASRKLKMLFSVVDETGRLCRLVRAAAFLAGHSDTVRLVSGIEYSTLADAADELSPEGKVWLHVLCKELGHDSPIEPTDVWAKSVIFMNPAGICLWLLAGYSADAIPWINTDAPLVSVFRDWCGDLNENLRLLSDRFEIGNLADPNSHFGSPKTLYKR